MAKSEGPPLERGPAGLPPLKGFGRLFSRLFRATLAKPAFRELLIGFLVFIALVGIMQIGLLPQRVKVTEDKPAPQTILAPKDVEDIYETRRLRAEARKLAAIEAEKDPANWYIARESGGLAEKRLDLFLSDIEQRRTEWGQAAGNATRMQAILENLRLRWPGLTIEAAEGLLALEKKALNDYAIALRKILLSIEENERISDLNLQDFRDNLAPSVKRAGGAASDRVLLGTLRALVAANLALDHARVDRLAEQSAQAVKRSYLQKGDAIIEKGQTVTAEKMQLLQALDLVAGSGVLISFLSMVLFILAMITLAVGYLYRFRREILHQERLLYLMALTMAIAAILAKFFALYPSPNLAYFAPVAFASILWVLLLDSQVALMLTILLGLLMGVVTGFQWSFTVYSLIGGATAIFFLHQRRDRADLRKSGLFISLANIFSVLLLTMLNGVLPSLREFGLNLAMAALNGVASAVIAIGLLPFLENLFGLTSAVHLLELANPNQPLLKRLLVEAPGTYNHSIVVGNLAVAAADAIGADALLVRVGAYYHDIGKTNRPYFFVENQLAQENPHEKLTPTLSTLIIIAHVKEGAELARKAGLPEMVIELIEQHHGTDLVRYFYARANEGSQTDLAETDFRYDGPRPRTKEAALVMLADSVEAAVRSVNKPTPAKIETLIGRVIKERLEDGQFDDCDLTLRDLERIKASFLKVLGGIFHPRIEYPESMIREFERKKGANGDSRKQPAG